MRFQALTSPFVDPIQAARAVLAFPGYLSDWHRYKRLPGAEPSSHMEMAPQLHDNTARSSVDSHYFNVNGWAMRRIIASHAELHVDIASQAILANLLAAVTPVVFLDYRPLHSFLDGLQSMAGSILALPFANNSLHSLSCLHVAEHIGLGRYGDPLDTQGTRKAAVELARVLAPDGNLYFALPVGRVRLCFNAHRIHSVETILSYFKGLELIEFSGVDDDGVYSERVRLSMFSESRYACGMFWFKKPAH